MSDPASLSPPESQPQSRPHPLAAIILQLYNLDPVVVQDLLAPEGGRSPSLAQIKKKVIAQRLLNEEAFQQAVAQLFALEFFPHLDEVELVPEFAQQIPIRYAKKFMAFPLRFSEDALVVAVENPEQFEPIEDMGRRFGKPVQVVLTTHAAILSLINRAYDRAGSSAAEQNIEGIDGVEGADAGGWGIEEAEDLIDVRDEEPIKRLLNNILYQASRNDTSDVHIDSNPNEVVVRFRVDGVLNTVTTLPKSIQVTLINRIKIMSRLDISQRGLPQDGRTLILIAGRKIDIRVSTLPTVHGEKAVLRLLYQDQDRFSLPKLGMPEDIYNELRRLIKQSGGIILVCGPTGSGKTTTLYAALSEIDRHANNIMTIEDPVEYKIAGYVQTEINPRLGLTFANALRSVLRQDPDIIMVGEMRDKETALIAIQAALTGHTVFSTLHTNDAPSSVTRLVDMGIEPYLVSSTVIAVLAQRLLRRICPHCRTKIPAEVALLKEAGLGDKELKKVKKMYKGTGCHQCRGTGYLGRVGLFELLHMTDAVKKVLQTTNEANLIREAAQESGMVSMRQAGFRMILEGITTAEELVSATRED